jgi:hypothetical protein
VKAFAFAVLCAASILTSAAAFAGPDDAKWVAQCVSDNKDEKASVEVITKYCTCMNSRYSARSAL